MNYNFDIAIAQELGVNAAIVINNLQFWIKKNEANGKHLHDGRYWTFNSNRAWKELFPFWTENQIRKILDDLVTKDIIIKGNYNELKYDRTLWYAFSDNGNSICEKTQMKVGNIPNRSEQNHEPIPDKNTDIKPDKNTDRDNTSETTDIQIISECESTATEIKPEKIDLNEIVAEFNRIVIRLPRVTALTDKRRKLINARLNEYGREALSVCFYKAGKSNFLAGENDRGWVASFDWILKSENFVKVYEGNYDPKVSVPKNLQGAMNNLANQMSGNNGGDIFGL